MFSAEHNMFFKLSFNLAHYNLFANVIGFKMSGNFLRFILRVFLGTISCGACEEHLIVVLTFSPSPVNAQLLYCYLTGKGRHSRSRVGSSTRRRMYASFQCGDFPQDRQKLDQLVWCSYHKGCTTWVLQGNV